MIVLQRVSYTETIFLLLTPSYTHRNELAALAGRKVRRNRIHICTTLKPHALC
jgi:hypothetical protein